MATTMRISFLLVRACISCPVLGGDFAAPAAGEAGSLRSGIVLNKTFPVKQLWKKVLDAAPPLRYT
jgi:hypothetical protein